MLKKLVCFLIFVPTILFAAEFIEGKEFIKVTNPQPVDNKNKTPVVTEFFSYGCPWCYKIDEPLNEWIAKMGKNVQLERVPVVFKPEWDIYAKAYYTAKALVMAEKLSPQLFKTIQVDKKSLATKQAMIDFFASHGVDKEIVKSAFENSPTIDMRVQNGMALMANYQVNGVPAFVVNHKYKTDLQMAGSQERLFQILDYLIKK